MTAPLVRDGAFGPPGRGAELTTAMGIGAATAASGVALMVMPRLALRLLGAGRSNPAPFFFRVIGMFMAVSGGSMVDVCRLPNPSDEALRWVLAAKTGAAVMVSGGVRSRRMGKQALALAIVDAASAGLILRIMRRR